MFVWVCCCLYVQWWTATILSFTFIFVLLTFGKEVVLLSIHTFIFLFANFHVYMTFSFAHRLLLGFLSLHPPDFLYTYKRESTGKNPPIPHPPPLIFPIIFVALTEIKRQENLKLLKFDGLIWDVTMRLQVSPRFRKEGTREI